MTTFCGRASIAVLVCCIGVAANAATYLVTKTADTFDGVCDADCSLREAVQAANEHRGADNIRLAPGTYTLTRPSPIDTTTPLDEEDNVGGDLDIKDDLSIAGSYGATTVIDANHIDRIFQVFPHVRFNVNNLTITNGSHANAGGGLYNAGATTMTNSLFIGNSVGNQLDNEYAFGGAIANFGTLTLEHTDVTRNGILNEGRLSDAGGGAIYNAGVLTIHRSNVSLNTSLGDVGRDDWGGSGGGLFNAVTGRAFIDQSLFIYNASGPFDGEGDGIRNFGSLTITNSSFSGQRRGQDGGGGTIVNEAGGVLKMSFVTIADNTLGLVNAGTATLVGTLIAGNFLLSAAQDQIFDHYGVNCRNSGTLTTENTLLGLDGGNCTAQVYVDNTTVFSRVVEPLRLDGGSTGSFRLVHDSPAIDAFNPLAGSGACPATDQRGAPRPPLDDGRRGQYCDIGAYEIRQ